MLTSRSQLCDMQLNWIGTSSRFLNTGYLIGKFDRRPFRPIAEKSGSKCGKVYIDSKVPMNMMCVGKPFFFLTLDNDYSVLTVA